MLAAEKLFAQHGYHAVTIRQIAVEAEAEAPLARVGYYNGQKHELSEAVVEHWHATIVERLSRLRDAVDTAGPNLPRDSVVFRGWCEAPGAARIGFGECRGTALPAREA